MNKMNPEIKARWVAALRSGAYDQGKGELRDSENRFCCLGVLCDVRDPAGWSPTSGGYQFEDASDWELPPRPLTTWAGFDWDRVSVVIDGREDTLYNHNDAGATFEQIADAIEEQL